MPHTKEQRKAFEERKKAAGLCVDGGCWNKSVSGKCRCQKHRDRQDENRRKNSHGWKKPTKEDKKEYWAKLKKEVFDAYGRECTCCGETLEPLLTIDHVNNDGKKHREEVGGSHSIYLWLRRNSFPPEFQTLCYSCNTAKFRCGICPHQTMILDSVFEGMAC